MATRRRGEVPRAGHGRAVRFGVVSDTHGLFDPLLATLFAGVEAIVHAGDICGDEVIERLEALAPVRAISGNCDAGLATGRFPPWALHDLAGARVLVLHDLGRPDKQRPEAQTLVEAQAPDVVISGHSHIGRVDVEGGRLFLNPGSAGRKRFKLVRSAALLEVAAGRVTGRLFSIEGGEPEELASASLPRAT